MSLNEMDPFSLATNLPNLKHTSTCTYLFKPFVFKKCYPTRYGSKPKSRSGHRAVCNDSDLFSYGGYNPNIKQSELADDEQWLGSKPLFRELWKFNFATRTWTKLPATNVPLVLASNAVLLEGRILFVYGGTGVPFGGHCSNSLYVCDLNEDPPNFKEVAVRGSMPEPQYGQAAFIVNDDHLYVIGGTTGFEYSADVHKFNLATQVWSDSYLCKGLPHEPSGRYRHELGVHIDKVFMLGGGTTEESFGFKDIPVFNFIKEQWTTVTTQGDSNATGEVYPKSRRFHSCVKVPNSPQLVIIGGYNGYEILDDCWLFNLETLKWKKLFSLKLPFPTYFHSSCITPAGKLYNFGGICEVGKRTHRTSDVHSAWVCIPKLKEICWEAVLHYEFLKQPYCPDLLAHIPAEFISRLPSDFINPNKDDL